MFSSLFSMQYVKIFSLVCSVSITQKVYTSWTSTFNLATFREILPPSFTKKACKFVIKRGSKNFLEVAKGIERLQQNSSVKLRFSGSALGKSSDRVFFTKIEDITPCFEHIFQNNLKDNVYRQVYSYKYCRLLPKQESITDFLLGIVSPLKISRNCPSRNHFLI